MKLYLLKQNTNEGYDTYDSCVVCAKDEETARHIHPDWEFQKGKEWWKEKKLFTFCQKDWILEIFTGFGAAWRWAAWRTSSMFR